MGDGPASTDADPRLLSGITSLVLLPEPTIGETHTALFQFVLMALLESSVTVLLVLIKKKVFFLFHMA